MDREEDTSGTDHGQASTERESAPSPAASIDAIDEALSSLEERALTLNRYFDDRPTPVTAEVVAGDAEELLAELRRQGSRIDELSERVGNALRAPEPTPSADASVAERPPTMDRDVLDELEALRSEVADARVELHDLRQDIAAVVGADGDVDTGAALEAVAQRLDGAVTSLADLIEGVPEQDQAVVDQVIAAFGPEISKAVDPLRERIDVLADQLQHALGRESELGRLLATLADEVRRLRRRMPVGKTSARGRDEGLVAGTDTDENAD